MKKFLKILLIAMFICQNAIAADNNDEQMDGDSLRKILNPSERDHYIHSKEIKSDEMHLLLRKRSPKNNDNRVSSDNPDTSRSPKHAGSDIAEKPLKGNNTNPVTPAGPSPTETESGSQSFDRQNPTSQQTGNLRNATSSRKTKSKDRYIPPSWTNSAARQAALGGFQTDSIKKSEGPFFGIRMGTKIRAYLTQITTNVEQNLAEVRVEQDVFGDYRVLEKGTKLYCKKSLNPGTKKLELLAVKGITPQGEEFKLNAIVLDINNAAGLVGAVSTDGKTTKRSLAAGVFGVGEALMPMLNDGSAIGAGVEAAAENALEEKETETDVTLNKPSYIIYVNPQEIKIRVEKTF